MRMLKLTNTFILCIIILIQFKFLHAQFNEKFRFDTIYKNSGQEGIVVFFTETNKSHFIYELKYPVPIYETVIRKFAIYKNGFIGLDDMSIKNVPDNYPQYGRITQKRLQDFDGRYLSVYSSVNDENNGVIRVREIDPYSSNEMSCEEKLQVERLINFTHTHYLEEETFYPQSILIITWLNMTKYVDNNLKTNSYSLIIISNGIHSYGFMQYWTVEWNELNDAKHMSPPPEAGIFMRPIGGYQLPRSGQPVEPIIWTSESNVALPGEWLIPLHNLNSVVEANVNKLNKIKMHFLHQLKLLCESNSTETDPGQLVPDDTIVLHLLDINNKSQVEIHNSSASEKLGSVLHKSKPTAAWNYMFDEADASVVESLELGSNESIDKNKLQINSSTTTTDEAPIIVIPETTPFLLGLHDGDNTRQPVLEDEIIPQIVHPLYKNETKNELNAQLTKCDAVTQCRSHNTECYMVQQRACCSCGEGFFGAGNTKCWSEANEHKFAFYGEFINRMESAQNRSYNIYLDIQHGSFKRSSSGLRGGKSTDDFYRTLRLTTPIFHVINSLISSKCDGISSTERVYNLFTLSDGLKEQFRLQFFFEIEQVGRFTIQITLKLDEMSSGSYVNGQLQFEMMNAENLKLVQHDYREAYSGSDNPEQTYYASYKIDDNGRIVFDRQKVKFVMESNVPNDAKALYVYWSAVADSQSCLLQSGSPIPKNKMYYIRLKERGYCSEDCGSPESGCHLFCVDEPVILPEQPTACDCVVCDREGEVCQADHYSYHCDCAPGLQRTHEGMCRAVPSIGVTDHLGPQCGAINCHIQGRCINPNEAFCQCLPGYRGDGISHCEIDPCTKCKRNEMCENGVCIPSLADLCEGIHCGQQAFCQDGRCICNPGYTGDPVIKCYEERELCAGVQCHPFGQCYENRCYCGHGYVGDGVTFCDARTDDPCDGVRCAENGRCQQGRCACNPGYEGDGYHDCRLLQDKCANVRCHPNAQCVDGSCRCVAGFEGDGLYDCRPMQNDKCANVRCHPNAQCVDGSCRCVAGFEGDGLYDCRPMQNDLCSRVRCHERAICQDGYCRCVEGFIGDGYSECKPLYTDICKENECHQYARCSSGRCQCLHGFEGDGYRECNPTTVPIKNECGTCRGVPFPELAQCIDGKCVCAQGFIETQPGVCMECVQGNCHPNAICRPDEKYNGARSCECRPSFIGDGVSVCRPDAKDIVRPSLDLDCTAGCHIRNSECDRSIGRCRCRSGYDGDGMINCEWNCGPCLPNAVCDKENERCVCPMGYHGDGQTYCELIPVKPNPIQVEIINDGKVMQVTDLSRPLEMRCLIRTTDRAVMGHWTQPLTAQRAVITTTSVLDGYEVLLRIDKPLITDSGRYQCRAGNEEAAIDVVIEESAVPFTIFLTSDDGILRTTSTDSNLTKAKLWNIAENNKYGRVAMTTDCNHHRVIYTNEYGHSIRWGDANSEQKSLQTSELINSKLSRFRNLAVDHLSGNIFAWDELNSKITILNPEKPNMRHTLKTIKSLTSSIPQNFAGLAVHPTHGLIYFALFKDGWKPNGTIQVASMTGDNEKQLIQLTGEPMALSLFAATAEINAESAGRLCWIQRSMKGIYGLVTELHCARLNANGRQIIVDERIKEFTPTQEPSWGMTQYKDAVLWTDAMRTVYYSINPERKVRVKHVCCSNRFQSISVLMSCSKVSNNPCSYSNGHCRYLCLPNEDRRTRTCVCPDEEPACHREVF